MEHLKAYCTREGWQNDWRETKKDFCNMRETFKEDLSDIIQNYPQSSEHGGATVRAVASIALIPVGMYAGMKIGDWSGFAAGWYIDHIPYIRDLAPWVAAQSGYTGFMAHAKEIPDFNQKIFAACGAVVGAFNGIFLPGRSAEYMRKRKTPK